MANKTIYIYSKKRDYIKEEYSNLCALNNSKLLKGNKKSFSKFVEGNPLMQLDTETNVTDFYMERELYVIQFGDTGGMEQHIFDYSDLPGWAFDKLKEVFENEDNTFMAHNAKFEYKILYKTFGVYIKNFMDTMLMARLTVSGLEDQDNSLIGLLKFHLGIRISKDQQTTYTGDKMTPEQLIYAATDVLYLYDLYQEMLPTIEKWKLGKKLKLENKTLRALGDMEINGMLVDTDLLDDNIRIFGEDEKRLYKDLVTMLKNVDKPSIADSIKELGFIQRQDEVIINWNSSVQKRKILVEFYPGVVIKSTSIAALKKLAKTVDNPTILNHFLEGNFDKIEDKLIGRHMKFLRKEGLYKKKGDININFNSNKQLLELFKLWYPNLRSVGVKALKKLKQPIVTVYKKYTKAVKLSSSFGANMYNFIESDGRIRSDFNQLVSSGSRMSSKNPNIQNSPSTALYRRMYVPRKGWSLVDTDYSSAEMVLSAYLSKDENLLYAVRNGYDIHAYSAYIIFGDAWTDAGESAVPKEKPVSEEGRSMRKKVKALSFGLLYGLGVVNFSENAGVSLREGKILKAAYAAKFPRLTLFFKESGDRALKNLYVREPYFGGTRFFNRPTNGMEVSHLKNAAMNYKPQAANGNIMKYAMCLVKSYVEKNDLYDKVTVLVSIHDEILTEVRDDFAEDWAIIQTELLEKAALYAIPEGTLKAETTILKNWTK